MSNPQKHKIQRQSDARRSAQLQDGGVTPHIFRAGLRSDANRRSVALPQAPARADVKPEDGKPGSEAASIKKDGPAPSPIDLTEQDVDVILDNKSHEDNETRLRVFEPGMWLNDDAIDVIIREFSARDIRFGRVSSTESTILQRSQSERIPAALRKRFRSLAVTDLWLMPVCDSGHWVLFVGHGMDTIDYFDSLLVNGYKTRMVAVVNDFLRCVWGTDVALPEPRTVMCHQQPNGFDCGLHVLRNADIVTRHPGSHHIIPLLPDELRAYYKDVYQRLL
ncbi:hypothetical protein CGRA01v4_15017 [Colletotrichum graminicola]|uniref:Ubiquitin-like protease family profile domain-containing protein n=1 Tax=Colletotrichum graminicola (strain M1.001 / M2 / FGSC 10212) TaxID=645133 RepID=E3R106_COLGM|nr:uncharacterized protein GLRG_11940 [Colletotrichum graminicola M1.001]EFQ36794.1 hypothetical protein GLRG_11940 [Colletotrichum graminicola M1.001]WDK23725.1 hypothetical protein CGRA01v4_15017 [Colletotrichum graminicola]